MYMENLHHLVMHCCTIAIKGIACFEHWARYVVRNFSIVADSYSCGLSIQLGFTERDVMQNFGLHTIQSVQVIQHFVFPSSLLTHMPLPACMCACIHTHSLTKDSAIPEFILLSYM